jgi:DNA invertase Pin-like site-specific DNA recombinase
MRILGAVRLSRYGGEQDPSTSPERQRAVIEALGEEVVGWATDLDVSASKHSPFDRPELGEWLRHPERYEAIAWQRLDRAVRSMGDLHELARWALDHRKVLIFASGPGGQQMTLDFRSGPLNPLTMILTTLMAFAAEMEATTIRERIVGMKADHRASGRHSGGGVPWWLMVAENGSAAGKTLVLHPEQAPVVRELVERVLAGESQAAVCRDFNRRAAGGKTNWARESNVYRMLRNRALVGDLTHYGEVIRDSDGFPIRRAEALLTRKEFEALQRVLERNRGRSPRDASRVNLLTGLTYCLLCGGQRNYHQQTIRGRLYRYSRCQNSQMKARGSPDWCESMQVPAEDLERHVERAFLGMVGNLPVLTPVYHPAESHVEEIAEVEAALDDLLRRVEGKPPTVAGVYERRIASHEARLVELKVLPELPERVTYEEAGETYGQRWSAATTAERNQMLIDGGYRVLAAPDTAGLTPSAMVAGLFAPSVQTVYELTRVTEAPFPLVLGVPLDVAKRLGSRGSLRPGTAVNAGT